MSNSYCVLPFRHLATHPHGGVTLCCISDHTNGLNRARTEDGTMLDLNNNTVEEIMNSDYFCKVRKQMLNGEQPAACRRCYAEEASGIRSKRVEENANLQFNVDDAKSITEDSGKLTNVGFKFIELRLGNVCNVKCRTCNPASSTSWKTEYDELQKDLPFVTKYDWTIDSSWIESDTFWDDLLQHSQELELIYINGGEPTLVEKHWGFLQRLIDIGVSKNIKLWYSINMTKLPEKLLEIWKQFKAVDVSCSIDDLYERNEYIRTGTKWETVMQHLDELHRNTWINTSVCQTVSIYNINTLPEFHAFMKKRGLHVHMNFCTDPKFLAVNVLSDDEKEQVMKDCSVLDPWKYDMVRHHLYQPTQSTLDKTIQYITWLDRKRDTNFGKCK